mgnify:CR=1 FL=1
MGMLKRKAYFMYFPRAGLVEVASVLGRSGLNASTILGVLDAVRRAFIVVGGGFLLGKALEVALAEAPSGFDTCFIALALKTRGMLLADDERMAAHARNLGVQVMLMRAVSEGEILRKLDM